MEATTTTGPAQLTHSAKDSILGEGLAIYRNLCETYKEIRKKTVENIELTSGSLSSLEAKLAKRKAELQLESAQMGKNDTERRALLEQALANDDTYTDLISDKYAEEGCRDKLEAEISELHGMAKAYQHALSLFEAYMRSSD